MYYLIFLQHRVSDQPLHTATVTSKALTVDSKTSLWRVRLEQPTILKSEGCDTQGVKK